VPCEEAQRRRRKRARGSGQPRGIIAGDGNDESTKRVKREDFPLADKDRTNKPLWTVAFDIQGSLDASFRSVAPEPADRADLMQQTYERLLPDRPERIVRTPESYVRRTAHNVAIDYLRSRHPERQLPLDLAMLDERPDAAPGPEELADRTQEQCLMRSISERLPEVCREVFRLDREVGLSHDAIAQRLNISPNTVKNHLTHALKVFRRELGRIPHEGIDGKGR
jgi:RNA polymerase sigma factor (sigma-70 family)